MHEPPQSNVEEEPSVGLECWVIVFIVFTLIEVCKRYCSVPDIVHIHVTSYTVAIHMHPVYMSDITIWTNTR